MIMQDEEAVRFGKAVLTGQMIDRIYTAAVVAAGGDPVTGLSMSPLEYVSLLRVPPAKEKLQ